MAIPITVVPGDDVEKCADAVRPFLALYAGGMGARGANFHFEVFARMGYEDVALKVQDLYLAGKKDEALRLFHEVRRHHDDMAKYLLVRNALPLPARTQPGITFALHRVLRLGIILLGLRLSLQDVIATGLSSLLLIVVCITLALTLAELLQVHLDAIGLHLRVTGQDRRLVHILGTTDRRMGRDDRDARERGKDNVKP